LLISAALGVPTATVLSGPTVFDICDFPGSVAVEVPPQPAAKAAIESVAEVTVSYFVDGSFDPR
jgi:hypothetical protein